MRRSTGITVEALIWPTWTGPGLCALCLLLVVASASWCAAEPAPDDLLALNAEGDFSHVIPDHTSMTISGAQLGGLIGLDLTVTIEFLDNTHLHPFIDASAGLSGMRYGLGAIYLTDPKKHWLMLSLLGHRGDDEINGGIGARAVIIDMSKLVRIIEINETDMYVTVETGCTWRQLEGMLVVAGLSLTPGVYRDERTHEWRWALAYGIGF